MLSAGISDGPWATPPTVAAAQTTVAFQPPSWTLGQELGYAVALTRAYTPSPPPLLPGVELPMFADAATVGAAFARKYGIEAPITEDGRLSVTGDGFRDTMIPQLRERFDSKVREVSSVRGVIGRFLGEGLGGPIVAQAVGSGLLTYQVAADLRDAVAARAGQMLESGVRTFRISANWTAPTKFIPRLLGYGLIFDILYTHLPRFADVPMGDPLGFAVFMTCMAMSIVEPIGFMIHGDFVIKPGDSKIDDGQRALAGARAMLSIPYEPPKEKK